MPSWLVKVRNAAEVVWVWVKTHIVSLFLGVALLYAFFFAKNKNANNEELLSSLLRRQQENNLELAELRKAHAEELAKQQEINKRYNEVLDRLERDYKDQLKTLDLEKEADLRRIIATNHDDPSVMARDINILFGIPIFP